MFRSSLKKLANRVISRSVTTRSLEQLSNEKPIPGLVSLQGWQRGCIDRIDYYSKMLNDAIKGNEILQNKSVEELIAECGMSTSKRNIANYASLLYNIEFSISSLKGFNNNSNNNNNNNSDAPILNKKPTKASLLETPDLSLDFNNEPKFTGNNLLQDALESSFGSMVQFRTLLLNSNMAISGDGFTWLVARVYKPKIQTMNNQVIGDVKYDKLFVFNTYNAGSPFIMNKSNIMNNLEKEYQRLEREKTQSSGSNSQSNVSKSASSYYNEILSSEEIKKIAFNDTTYVPLLAIDASPKFWLYDYGVFGKKEYLNRVWDSINWSVVESRLPQKYELKYN